MLASPGMTISRRCCRKGFGVRPEPADHRAVIREPATAVLALSLSLSEALCARWRGTGPDVLNDLPTAVGLAFEDDYLTSTRFVLTTNWARVACS